MTFKGEHKQYFDTFSAPEEFSLYSGLSWEAVEIFGFDVWYLPASYNSEYFNKISGNIEVTNFKKYFKLRMYQKNSEGFDGNGDLYGMIGLEFYDQVSFVVNIAQFEYETNITAADGPKIGDVIYVPFDKGRLYQITHVEDEADAFYHFGKKMMYRLDCKLMDYNHENIQTGVPQIDSIPKELESIKPDNTAIDDAAESLIDDSESNPLGSV